MEDSKTNQSHQIKNPNLLAVLIMFSPNYTKLKSLLPTSIVHSNQTTKKLTIR
jgi:hypothetical protein